MTVVNVPSSVVYAGTGTVGEFDVAVDGVTIPFIQNSDIKVRTMVVATEVVTSLAENVDYTLTPISVSIPGKVTLAAGNLALGVKLEIYRDEAVAQAASFIQGTSFPAATVEAALDKECRISQQISDVAGRAISISRFDSYPDANLEIPLDRADAVLGFDSSGNVVALKPGDFAEGIAGAPCSVNWLIDGAGFPIASGYSGEVVVPFAMTITRWTMIADVAGSIAVDIWRTDAASFPPSASDSITGSSMPQLSGVQFASRTSLTGWQTSVAAGDILAFYVSSSATVNRVTIALQGTRV